LLRQKSRTRGRGKVKGKIHDQMKRKVLNLSRQKSKMRRKKSLQFVMAKIQYKEKRG